MVKCYLYIVMTFASLEVSYFQVCSSLLSEIYISISIYIYIVIRPNSETYLNLNGGWLGADLRTDTRKACV